MIKQAEEKQSVKAKAEDIFWFFEGRADKINKADQADQAGFGQDEKINIVDRLEEASGGSDIAVLFHGAGEMIEADAGKGMIFDHWQSDFS